MYGLDGDQLQQLKTTFAQFPEIDRVILYGSRAKGTHKKGSDIDLTLVGRQVTTDILYTLSHCIDELYLPYECDISIYSQIDNEELLDHIKRVGTTMYTKNEERADDHPAADS